MFPSLVNQISFHFLYNVLLSLLPFISLNYYICLEFYSIKLLDKNFLFVCSIKYICFHPKFNNCFTPASCVCVCVCVSEQSYHGLGRLTVEVSTSHRHITLGRTPLNEWSARRRVLCLTTLMYKRQTSMSPAGFEPATPASGQPQTYALDRATTYTYLLTLAPLPA